MPSMNFRNHLAVPLLLTLFFLSANPAAAQFEGKIVFDSYEVSTDGSRERTDGFTLYVTPERLLLQGENRYSVIGSIQTEGILVRLDFQDFVFLTENDATALKISKQDITSMMNMFGGSGTDGNNPKEEELDFERTGETRTINGYRCEKFIIREADRPNDYVVAWMTQDLEINWGMLSEPWGSNELDVIGDNLHLDIIFNEGYFPLSLEAYGNGVPKEVTEVSEITASNIARAMVQVPSGVKVLSFQDYLFNKMSEGN